MIRNRYRPCDGLFVIGWSRSASDGVVGQAKLDGERGMAVVNRYLANAPRSARRPRSETRTTAADARRTRCRDRQLR
jgi:hypothetical protein